MAYNEMDFVHSPKFHSAYACAAILNALLLHLHDAVSGVGKVLYQVCVR